ncbi:MAG TPA: hypothetical protein VLB74_11290 [Flavobacterium sp.]|uniref:hypothetical protein n=1 Tax=Flavobacterium sp. TaxID=239 RepID=UPI002B54CA83|nr:hypothetical protein [Flavobacterium sp.]HSD15223.1 hypothetical protein [Flavobacterium sp.]
MKKILLFLVFSAFFFSSCSNDEAAQSATEQFTTNGTKLRKYVEKFPNGSIILGIEYEYEGDKLSRIIWSNGQIRRFYYTNDLITKTEEYGGNVIGQTTYFSYFPDGRMSGIVQHRNDGFSGRAEYLYNADNTVTVNNYRGDVESQDVFGGSYKFFLEDGVIVKKVNSFLSPMGTRTWTSDYTYDDKPNPLNAILGFGKLCFYEDIQLVGLHNVVKTVNSRSESEAIGILDKTYTYNDYGFPIKSTVVSSGGTGGTEEYYYEVP